MSGSASARARGTDPLPADPKGYSALIVGQDVANQLACDYLRHLAETYRERAQVAAQVGARGSAATAGAEEPERSEHELKEERRREREAEAKAER